VKLVRGGFHRGLLRRRPAKVSTVTHSGGYDYDRDRNRKRCTTPPSRPARSRRCSGSAERHVRRMYEANQFPTPDQARLSASRLASRDGFPTGCASATREGPRGGRPARALTRPRSRRRARRTQTARREGLRVRSRTTCARALERCDDERLRQWISRAVSWRRRESLNEPGGSVNHFSNASVIIERVKRSRLARFN